MLAKIISAGALTLLLSSGALAYLPQQHNIYAGHSNGQQQSANQQYAANTVPYTQGSNARSVD
jgi:hypothetical protein